VMGLDLELWLGGAVGYWGMVGGPIGLLLLDIGDGGGAVPR
jgi:hypothetical protein